MDSGMRLKSLTLSALAGVAGGCSIVDTSNAFAMCRNPLLYQPEVYLDIERNIARFSDLQGPPMPCVKGEAACISFPFPFSKPPAGADVGQSWRHGDLLFRIAQVAEDRYLIDAYEEKAVIRVSYSSRSGVEKLFVISPDPAENLSYVRCKGELKFQDLEQIGRF